jgi:hypothetical protein
MSGMSDFDDDNFSQFSMGESEPEGTNKKQKNGNKDDMGGENDDEMKEFMKKLDLEIEQEKNKTKSKKIKKQTPSECGEKSMDEFNISDVDSAYDFNKNKSNKNNKNNKNKKKKLKH